MEFHSLPIRHVFRILNRFIIDTQRARLGIGFFRLLSLNYRSDEMRLKVQALNKQRKKIAALELLVDVSLKAVAWAVCPNCKPISIFDNQKRNKRKASNCQELRHALIQLRENFSSSLLRIQYKNLSEKIFHSSSVRACQTTNQTSHNDWVAPKFVIAAITEKKYRFEWHT